MLSSVSNPDQICHLYVLYTLTVWNAAERRAVVRRPHALVPNSALACGRGSKRHFASCEQPLHCINLPLHHHATLDSLLLDYPFTFGPQSHCSPTTTPYSPHLPLRRQTAAVNRLPGAPKVPPAAAARRQRSRWPPRHNLSPVPTRVFSHTTYAASSSSSHTASPHSPLETSFCLRLLRPYVRPQPRCSRTRLSWVKLSRSRWWKRYASSLVVLLMSFFACDVNVVAAVNVVMAAVALSPATATA